MEEKYKSFLRAQRIARIGSWDLDFKTNTLEWSTEHYKIFEIDESIVHEELYNLYRDRIHPEDLLRIDYFINRAKEKGMGFSFVHRLIFTDGRIKYVEGIGEVIKDELGNSISLSGTCQNITERILKEQKNEYILEVLKIGVWRYNPTTNKLFWDQSMLALYGLKESEFSGDLSAWMDALTPESKEQTKLELELALRGEKEFDTTFQIKTSYGEKKYIRAYGKVIRNRLGEVEMMFGVNQNCTKEKELENNLNLERTKSLHSAKLASLGEMSAGIAHEINNPLTIISGSIFLLDKLKEDPEKFKLKLEAIQKSVERITKIVSGLKKFSRLNTISTQTAFSLKEIIKEALVLTESKAKRHSVKIESSFHTNAKIMCDDVEIEQVIINLINNGIDAVKELSEKWVKIYVFESLSDIIVQIKDSGFGIMADVEQKMFNPFFTTKPVGQGTGLGLSIVRGILDQHKASISINRDDCNTCFEIRFPMLIETEKIA